jgi:hypothetical protein
MNAERGEMYTDLVVKYGEQFESKSLHNVITCRFHVIMAILFNNLRSTYLFSAEALPWALFRKPRLIAGMH